MTGRPLVAIDARKLWDGGIGTYIRELLSAFARGPGRFEFAAMMDPSDLGRMRWPRDAVREVGVRSGKYGLAEHVAVARAARALGAALLHAPHYTLPMGWSGPAVVTIHDLIHVRFWRFFPPGAGVYALAMAGAAAHRARHVITDSEHVREDVIELLRVPESKVTAIPLAPPTGHSRRSDAEVSAWRESRGIPRDYLLYVGARKRHKNLGLLLEAHARLASHTRPPLVLSGPTFAAGDPLARHAARLGTLGEIAFAGDLRDPHALACAYSGALLYVHPSLAEGFGLPPLEAMACGAPVLASNAGSLPEAVGNAGLMLPPDNPEIWATVIAQLAGDPTRRAAMAKAGLTHAARFTWNQTATRTLEIYEAALS